MRYLTLDKKYIKSKIQFDNFKIHIHTYKIRTLSCTTLCPQSMRNNTARLMHNFQLICATSICMFF